MPISQKHKCIFIHIPKTAGTSIESCLDMHGDLDSIGLKKYTNQTSNFDTLYGNDLQHLRAKEIEAHVGKETFETYYKFSIVRSPYTRAVSDAAWEGGKWEKKETLSQIQFDKYIENLWTCYEKKNFTIHNAPQNTYLFSNGKSLVDFIGKQESLTHDWKIIQRILNVKCELPKRMQSSYQDPFSYYNKQSLKIIETVYSQDFELLDYPILQKTTWQKIRNYFSK